MSLSTPPYFAGGATPFEARGPEPFKTSINVRLCHAQKVQLTAEAKLAGSTRGTGAGFLEPDLETQTENERGTRALAHLKEAQRALDEGRLPEVLRVCYRAQDGLSPLLEGPTPDAENTAGTASPPQLKETKALCNPERHGEQPGQSSQGFTVAHPLAVHLLALTSSLAGVLLA